MKKKNILKRRLRASTRTRVENLINKFIYVPDRLRAEPLCLEPLRDRDFEPPDFREPLLDLDPDFREPLLDLDFDLDLDLDFADLAEPLDKAEFDLDRFSPPPSAV